MSEKQKMGMGMRITQKQVLRLETCNILSCSDCKKENPQAALCPIFHLLYHNLPGKVLDKMIEEEMARMLERRDNPKKTLVEHIRRSSIPERRKEEILSKISA